MRRCRFLALLLLPALILSLSGCTLFAPKPPAPRPAKVALVLGAGASKGFAHVGVLKILEQNRVPVHMIVGTSVGSFVGSLYASGYSAYDLQKIALAMEKGDVADLGMPDNGFIKGERLRDFVNEKVRKAPLEKLKIPFHAVATDIKSGKSVVFSTGNTGMAVQASCSIPGVFRPATFGGTSYVDGGVLNPLAVDVARRMGADVVIAVDISSGIDKTVPASTIATIMKSVDLMYNRMSRDAVKEADVVIRPNVDFIGSADFERRNEAIMEGEKAALAAMPAIKTILDKLRQDGALP